MNLKKELFLMKSIAFGFKIHRNSLDPLEEEPTI